MNLTVKTIMLCGNFAFKITLNNVVDIRKYAPIQRYGQIAIGIINLSMYCSS